MGEDWETWIDIGHGVRIQFRPFGDHEHAGLAYTHPRPDGAGRCYGGIQFDLPGMSDDFTPDQLWQLEVLDPLTIAPSLLCGVCGHHGFIRSGRWVPA